MNGLNLLLTVSANGLLARGPDDNMIWPGDGIDKTIFRMLSLIAHQPILVGSTSYDILPPLPGREVIRISRDEKAGALTLRQAAERHPGAWLIGGPTAARAALEEFLVDTAVICRLSSELQPFTPIEGYWEKDFLGRLRGVHPTPVTFRRDNMADASVRVLIYKNLYRGAESCL
jgi:dihydrofolate reductase